MIETCNIRKMIYKFLEYQFSPHQPYLECNDKYISYKPNTCSPLSGVVWEVYQVEHFDHNKHVTFPDLCGDLMVLYTPKNSYCYYMGGSLYINSMKNLPFWDSVHTIFGVKFCTGALGNLFKIDAKDVGNCAIEGMDILWQGQGMLKQLSEAENFNLRWSLVEQYLHKRLSLDYEINLFSNYIAKSIVDNRGIIKVKDLEGKMGYSNRYLRKIIKDNLGLSIKQLCEITQFQWAYHIFWESGGRLSLSELAAKSGYYDQSHMNMHCRKLTGELPKDVLQLYRSNSRNLKSYSKIVNADNEMSKEECG